MTDFTCGSQSAYAENATLAAIAQIARKAIETLREWRHNYRSRRELAMYSHQERYDLSFMSDVDSEIAKPFWRK